MKKEGICSVYKCGHHTLMEYSTDRDKFTCKVKTICDQCESGIKTFYFGNLSFTELKCPHPNCSCTELEVQIPVHDAIKALRSNNH